MNYLTLEDLLEFHSMAVDFSGGSAGVRDIGRLESCVAVQTQEVFGVEVYVGMHEKAAAMIRGIIGDRPFVDGNKRSGMLAGLTLLELNGQVGWFELGEIEDFAVKVAVDHLEVSGIAEWLESHCA